MKTLTFSDLKTLMKIMMKIAIVITVSINKSHVDIRSTTRSLERRDDQLITIADTDNHLIISAWDERIQWETMGNKKYNYILIGSNHNDKSVLDWEREQVTITNLNLTGKLSLFGVQTL